MSNPDPRWRPQFKWVKRNVDVDGVATSIALEDMFWRGFDSLAREKGRTWREEVRDALEKKPTDYSSRAGWLRISVFAAVLRRSQRRRR